MTTQTAQTATAARSFADTNGDTWTVFNVRGVARRTDGWTGRTETVRTFARRQRDGVEVDAEAGMVFTAWDAVAAFVATEAAA